MPERDEFAGSFAFNDDEPTAIANGDFWVDGTSYNVYCRTGSQTVNLTDLAAGPALFNQSGAGTFADNSGVSNAGGSAVFGTTIGTVTGTGSFSHGHITAGTHTINADGDGSVAIGKAAGVSSGSIISSGGGSFSGGYINSANNITASGSGSFAWGFADLAAIVASATNAFQFGPGSNALADTVQIGNAGLRFKQDTGVPSALQNGDFWEASTNIYVRTGGVSVNLTNATSPWNREGSGSFSDTTGSNVGGYINSTGVINASAAGAFAHGNSTVTGNITSSSYGSFSFGHAKGTITAYTGSGNFAGGYANTSRSIVSSGSGSFAHGHITGASGSIRASASGCLAQGYATAANIYATSNGSFAQGYGNASSVTASSNGTFAQGHANGAAITASGTGALVQGFTASTGGVITAGILSGSFAQGATSGTGTIISSGGGSFAQGDAQVDTILASGGGSFAQGISYGIAFDGITASASGSFAQGRANSASYGINATTSGTFAQGYSGYRITASGSGSFAQGAAATTGGDIYASGTGSFAQGYASSSGDIHASNQGSFAQGATSGSSTIDADGSGSLAQGYAQNANIEASGSGSFAHGQTYGGAIIASSNGAFAHGYTSSGYSILASYAGAFACGYATGTNIHATANNAFQLGPGTNNQGDSLQVGTDVRFKGSDGAFSSPANGDFWKGTNEVFSRSDGRNRSFTKINETLDVDTTNVGNILTGIDNLITFTVPAATLATNGDSLEVTCMGTFAANANSKQVRLLFGAAVLFASGAQNENNASWYIKAHIIRTGAATQDCVASFSTDGTLFSPTASFVLATETLSGAVVVKCTGEGVATDDIVQTAMITKLVPG